MASTPVCDSMALLISCRTTFDISFAVPCNSSTPISDYTGGKEIEISPDASDVGSPEGSDVCLIGAASHDALTGGKLASDFLPGTQLISM